MTIIKGFKKMEGISKKTGNKYNGYILYCEEDRVPTDVKGVLCFEKFISVEQLSAEPYLGAEVRFYFDHMGRMSGCEVL